MTALAMVCMGMGWACIGATLAGLWWMRELRRERRFNDDLARQTAESYESTIASYRFHIDRLHRRLGLEALDEQDYVN